MDGGKHDMSVLIKGMKMPKTHPLTVTIYPDGQVLSETVGAKDIHGEAVPVPKHGRLGDLDEVYKDALTQVSLSFISCSKEQSAMAVASVIRYAPTIIPAEEGET